MISGGPAGLKSWLDAALFFFYPEVCQICGGERAGPGDGYVGATCRNETRFIQAPYCGRCGLPFAGEIDMTFECGNCRDMKLAFRSARSAVVAQGVVLDIIHRYKYQRALWFEPFLASLLVRQAGPVLAREPWDLIVPVPLHPIKRREREYNQAERLAARLGKATRIPVNATLLRRVKATRTQTRLARPARAENVRRAFVARPDDFLRERRVVLVDDVFTTGATTNACALALREAGAGEVCVWTVARGL